MKYAHLADLHLGSWQDPKMRDLSLQAFLKAMDDCIKETVDFILFSGDLFNTSLPSLDSLKIVTKKLKEVQEKNIPLYVIAGSHDFSPSGKTMIDVLENAGLLKNVCKGSVNPETKQLQLQFTIDRQTHTKITGILGRKGLLDKIYYQNLFLENLEQEPGYKIFLFHTTISELKPKHLEMLESQPASFLPKNFNYYAGGHLHHPTLVNLPDYGTLSYPGALFPNNFAEMEKYGKGGYYLITVENQQQKVEWIPLEIQPHIPINLECNHKNPETIQNELLDIIKTKSLQDHIVTLRLHGTLENGKISQINFQEIITQIYQQGAYFVMKNTTHLTSPEFEEIKIISANPEEAEEQIIREHLQQIKLFDPETEMHLTKSLLQSLNTSKREGETIPDFHKRLETETNKLLNI